MLYALRKWSSTAALFTLAASWVVAVAGGCASERPPPQRPQAQRNDAATEHVEAKATPDDLATTSRGAVASDERRAELDKRLNDSLGAFDAKLRSEQQKIAQERDARQSAVVTVGSSDTGDLRNSGSNRDSANGDGGSGASGDEGHGSDSADSDSHRADSHGRRGESRPVHGGDLRSDKTAGGNAANAIGNGAAANELPDGNDDDVVARRLRKAAEQETDPELKEKLWKEYVEYKKNTQGR